MIDAKGATDTATVTVIVGADKNDTKAINDRDTTEFGEAVDIDVLANDTDAQGDDQSIDSFDDTSENGGTITQNADGTLKYTPADGFTGRDTFTYTVIDAKGATDTATVTVIVGADKNDTKAINDRDTTEFGEAVDIDVLANDTDAQGDDQSIDSFDDTSANGGTITQNADGTLKYTPADGFTGRDTFTYTVIDAKGATDTATVTVIVGADKNDTKAINDRDTTEFGEAVDIDVLANDTDAQGDDQSIDSFDDTSANGGTITQNADGTLKYTPADGFTGRDTFTYTVIDAKGATDTATVTVIVGADKNDTKAINDRDTTEFGEAVDIDVLANDTDAQDDDQSIDSFDDTSANGGTITQNADGTLKYTPADGFTGRDTFTYTVIDAKGATDTATVTVIVGADKNDTKAINDRDTTEFGEAVDIDVLANDTDAQGDDQSIDSFDDTSANGGTITQNADGTLKYTPADGFTGRDTFTYTVIDAKGATDTATVTVIVGADKNTTIANDDEASTTAETKVQIDVLGNDEDPEGDGQSVQSFDPLSANGGMISRNPNGNLVYMPPAGFTGTDTFEYVVVDSEGNTDTATVTVKVEDVPNKPPLAVDDMGTGMAGEPVVIDVLGNDSDPDGDTLMIVETTDGANGTVTQDADGNLVYTPNDPNFTGMDTFTYTIKDGNGGFDTAEVKVTIEDDPKVNKIFGTDGNDKRIDGTDGDDQICAGDGHDCLYVSQGDDILDGQAGYDLVIYEAGSSDDYLFQANPDGTVTASGDFGTDLLIDIEGIYFEESQEWFKIEDLVDAH